MCSRAEGRGGRTMVYKVTIQTPVSVVDGQTASVGTSDDSRGQREGKGSNASRHRGSSERPQGW
jgi:hypothetical protein